MITVPSFRRALAALCVSALLPLSAGGGAAALEERQPRSPAEELLFASGPENYTEQMTQAIATSLISTEGGARGIGSIEQLTLARDEAIALVEPYTAQLITELAAAYGTVFSLEEIEDLTAFYQSDLGQKLVRLTPDINFLVNEAIHAHTVFLQEHLSDEIEALLADAQATAPEVSTHGATEPLQ